MLTIPRALVIGGTALLLLTGCAAPVEVLPSEPDGGIGSELPPGVPQECVDTFIGAVVPADPADLQLLPASWPSAPDLATLCVTSETADGMTETADFATPLSPEEVLAHYEAVLPDAQREIGGMGTPIVYGAVDGILYQIEPRDGSFRIIFSKADA